MTCSYEYVTDNINARSFLLFAFIVEYVMPLSGILFFYFQIIWSIVAKQDGALSRAKVKLMNVLSPPLTYEEVSLAV